MNARRAAAAVLSIPALVIGTFRNHWYAHQAAFEDISASSHSDCTMRNLFGLPEYHKRTSRARFKSFTESQNGLSLALMLPLAHFSSGLFPMVGFIKAVLERTCTMASTPD